MRFVRALMAVAVAAFLGCPGASSGDSVPTLVLHNGDEPQTLDPATMKGSIEHHINIALFEGLTTYDPRTLAIRPGIAERWEVSDDSRVYTFHLRAAKWSNGDPVTARDFEWSWKRVLDPTLASEYAYQISSYLKNSKAYYDGASADAALQAFDQLDAPKKLESAPLLVEQAQARHVGILSRLAEQEKNDEVRSWLRQAREKAAARKDVALDEVGVRAKDDRTLVVELEAPTPYFLDLTGFFTYYPVHRRTVEQHGTEWTRPGKHVGNGPYRMKEWKLKEYILLEKNPHYWDAANVPEQRLRILPITDTTTAFNLYEHGEIHWLTTVPLEHIDTLKKRPDFHTGPFLTTYFYAFNCKRGPTQKKEIRRALALAIDKEEIVRYITRAGEAVADSLVPPGMPGYNPATMSRYNPEAARRLLAEAGYPDGKGFPKIEILYNSQESHAMIAAAIQEMWRKNLGIEVELRNVEWKIYLDMQSRLDFDVIRRGWIGDYNDPNTFIDMFETGSGNNNTGFSNRRYDEIVRLAAREGDAGRRMALLREAEQILMEEQPIVPIYFYVNKNMWRDTVSGLYDNIRDIHPMGRVRIAGHAN